MKNPLHYQLSEYDCGPTSMLNAINYLLGKWGYKQNGIAGEKFIKKLASEINKKI